MGYSILIDRMEYRKHEIWRRRYEYAQMKVEYICQILNCSETRITSVSQ